MSKTRVNCSHTACGTIPVSCTPQFRSETTDNHVGKLRKNRREKFNTVIIRGNSLNASSARGSVGRQILSSCLAQKMEESLPYIRISSIFFISFTPFFPFLSFIFLAHFLPPTFSHFLSTSLSRSVDSRFSQKIKELFSHLHISSHLLI
jgi:hypothetical protein